MDIIKKERNASFELMRILCMVMIVYYHLLIKVDAEVLIDNPQYMAIAIPMHIAVVCFVLISGYFGIKDSWRKTLRFLVQVLFYNVLVYVVCALITHTFCVKDFICSFLPMTYNKDLWFVRTYFMFLLIVPMLNMFIKNTPPPLVHVKACLVLAFLSMYIGLRGDDASLCDGKNLVNFSMIYFIGHLVREYDVKRWFGMKKSICLFLLLNCLLCTCYIKGIDTVLPSMIIKYAFRYNAPILVLNAVLFFLVFVNLRFHSKAVLWVANSIFPVYFIHSNSYVQDLLWPIVKRHSDCCHVLVYYALIAIAIMICVIAIDKVLQPIYMRIQLYFKNTNVNCF